LKWINQTYRQLFDGSSSFKKLNEFKQSVTTNNLKNFIILRVVANFLGSLADLMPSAVKMQPEWQLLPLYEKY
jgi:hypothetical protein